MKPRPRSMAEELLRTSLKSARARDGNPSIANASGKPESKPPTKGGFFAGAPTAQARRFYHYTTASAICQGENNKKNK